MFDINDRHPLKNLSQTNVSRKNLPEQKSLLCPVLQDCQGRTLKKISPCPVTVSGAYLRNKYVAAQLIFLWAPMLYESIENNQLISFSFSTDV